MEIVRDLIQAYNVPNKHVSAHALMRMDDADNGLLGNHCFEGTTAVSTVEGELALFCSEAVFNSMPSHIAPIGSNCKLYWLLLYDAIGTARGYIFFV